MAATSPHFDRLKFMATVLLVVHITVAVTMIVLILLQRSEGGALGIGGGGGGLVSGRGATNFITRTTGILAAIFFTTSLTLGMLSHRQAPASAVVGSPAPAQKGEAVPASQPTPAPAPAEKAPESLPALKIPKLKPDAAQAPAPAAPSAPAQPQLPQSQ
jgi:preprotein translocase subunit SecG